MFSDRSTIYGSDNSRDSMRTFCGLTTDGMLDYLANIYKLDQREHKVTTGALAESMHVSAAAASSMLKRLEEAALIARSGADGVTLTDQGQLAALQLIRRHRLLEVFLVEVMGFSWDQVEAEAHRLEHSVSIAFEERMDALCGYPTHCPHGDPIPTKDGVIVEDTSIALVNLSDGQDAYIRRVATDDARILRYLSQLGLIPGQQVRLLEIAPFNGPVSLERLYPQNGHGSEKREQQILGHELARLLYVDAGVGHEVPVVGKRSRDFNYAE
jgi:DtxR family transcriptional regulator, Mn-dependent transcriptional regulator